ncbi:hypothetical protein DFJ73DRAFT_859801 [Zopfochytrium polystomum]|nr:hypothetical protein DFJ73DRAFT_859801 [Zopfochytrium polystomum]
MSAEAAAMAALTLEEDPAIGKLRDLLNRKMRVMIADGRVFVGIFMCIDKGLNMVLSGAEEYTADERRFAGLVMIPGKYIVRAEAEDYEASDVYS